MKVSTGLAGLLKNGGWPGLFINFALQFVAHPTLRPHQFNYLFYGSADPIFFQKRKEKEFYSSWNSFFLLVPNRHLMTSWLFLVVTGCDAYSSCLRLDQTRHSNKAFGSPPLRNADCEYHQTGGLGAEALVTFLMSPVVYVIMPFEDNTSWFCIKCSLCLHTGSRD